MTDQPPTNHTDHIDDATDRPPTTPEMVPLKEAAEILGIIVNAVRQRLKRGTLQGVKTDTGWLVSPTTDQPPTTAGKRPPTNDATTMVGRDQPPTNLTAGVDLTPLVDELSELRKENAQLSGAAAWLLSQNAQLQRELQELRTINATASEPPGSPTTNDAPAHEESVNEVRDDAPGGVWSWLRRLFAVKP